MILAIFADWCNKTIAALNEVDINAWMTYGGESDNSAARLDIETQNVNARIACWTSGACEMEILGMKSDDYIYIKSTQVSEAVDFNELCTDFMKYILASK